MAITDAFTGTNGTGIAAYSALWAYVIGSAATLQIQTNALACTNTLGDAQLAAQRTETPFPAAHDSQQTAATPSDNSAVSMGPAVRCQGGGTQQFVGYYFAGNASYLFTNDGVTWTQLGSAGAACTTNDVLKLAVSGTTYTTTVNGSATGQPGPQTNATFSDGAPGLCGYNNAQATSVVRLDSFSCTDVTAGGRTTKNTRSAPLGVAAGMNWRAA